MGRGPLPIEYFDVIFTLPHELWHDLWPLGLERPGVFCDLLFSAAAETLAAFAQDPRHFSGKAPNDDGGRIDVTAIFHTCDRSGR